MSHRGIMDCKWEVVHWPTGNRLNLYDSKEHAEKVAHITGAGYVVKEVWLYKDGREFKPRRKK